MTDKPTIEQLRHMRASVGSPFGRELLPYVSTDQILAVLLDDLIERREAAERRNGAEQLFAELRSLRAGCLVDRVRDGSGGEAVTITHLRSGHSATAGDEADALLEVHRLVTDFAGSGTATARDLLTNPTGNET